MPHPCANGRCQPPRWVAGVLLAAGFYHLVFAAWTLGWPHQWFDGMGVARPNHPLMWQGVGLMIGGLGLGLVIASKNPVRHWMPVLIGFAKCWLGVMGFGQTLIEGAFTPFSLGMLVVDDLIWLPPFAVILWMSVRAHSGVPPSRSEPYSIHEATHLYTLSNGVSLASAAQNQLLLLVFLRHFGCTFTRQILRELENLQREARIHGAELVLVHMLQNGREHRYLHEDVVARIADPRCELYRAFGLGKGGFFDLFGPRVLWRSAIALFKGCGVGHLAGDGLQMPGAFLFRNGEIVASQRAKSASELPDLPTLFQGLPSAVPHGRVTP
jgi:hypothetical protein